MSWQYDAPLKAIAARTGAPISSLVASFAILHELSAIIPVVSIFYAGRALGTGEIAVAYLKSKQSSRPTNALAQAALSKANDWLDQGEHLAAKIGRRYHVWGLDERHRNDEPSSNTSFSADVANFAIAYGITKALLPARIACSLYLSAPFARRTVDPLRTRIRNIIRS